MTTHKKIWRNGKMLSWDQATVHLMSHGFSRGVAIFEVFGTHRTPAGTCAFRMDMNLKRLARSMELLGLKLKYTMDEVARAVSEVVQANGTGDGYIKIFAYDATEAFANLVPQEKLDLCVVALDVDPDLDKKKNGSLSACICNWKKQHPGCVPVEAKVSANYLNGMMSRQEAYQRGADIGIMLDTHGFVAEGATESVFMVKNGVLATAPLGRVLAGVSRDSVLKVAESLGIMTQERSIRPSELLGADEIFISSSPFKVLSIHRIEDRSLPTVPGPVARQLRNTLDAICAGKNTDFKNWLTPLD